MNLGTYAFAPALNPPGQFDRLVRAVTLAASHGLTILPVVISTPSWEELPHPAADFALPKSNQTYANYGRDARASLWARRHVLACEAGSAVRPDPVLADLERAEHEHALADPTLRSDVPGDGAGGAHGDPPRRRLRKACSPEHYPFDSTPQGQARNLGQLLPLLAKNRRALGLAGFDV